MAGGREGDTGLLTQHLTPFPACIMNYVFKTDIHCTRIGDKMRRHHSIDVCSAGSRRSSHLHASRAVDFGGKILENSGNLSQPSYFGS